MTALTVCLVGLAILQYRWIGQISQAEQQRMQASLRTATFRFSRDFDATISHIYAALQMRRGRESGPLEDEYAGRWMDWTAASMDRMEVRSFYLAQVSARNSLDLSRLNRKTGAFEQVEWPVRFAALKARLETEVAADRPRNAMFADAVDREIPAVAAPIFHFAPPPPDSGPPRRGRFFRRPSIRGWAIAELDMDWIEKQLLPELVERYFAGAGGLDYQVGIVDPEHPERLVFSSDPKLTAGYFASADATVALFNLRPDLIIRQMERPGTRRGSNFAAERLRRREGAFPPPGGMRAGGWELRVRHVSGSLETAVANARHRNLAVSAASLLLLAATSLMLFLYTRRAQRLAELQIEFVAGVSHELRTPLSVICSAADNLADGLIAEAAHVRRYGAAIRKEGRRLSNMVDQILVFAATRAGRAKYNLQPVQVPEIIDRALDACGPDLRETGCEVEKSVSANLPSVMADPVSLMHCVRNLVSNAFHYGKDGRWIGVTAELGEAREGKEIRISVRDRGPGIESADLPHIFEPFYRGSKAVAAQMRGAGLGLSLVRRIIEAHAGAVTVTSVAGEGSCFTLHLPVGSIPPAVESK
jgi:signal transduction histidine kinase